MDGPWFPRDFGHLNERSKIKPLRSQIDLPDHSNRIAISIAVADFTLPITRCLIDNGADVNSNGAEVRDGL